MTEGRLLDILNQLSDTVGEFTDTLHGGPTECPVCLEKMTEPTILPSCGHTFCRKCLNEIRLKAGNTIRCPIDRQPCVLPENGVDGLPVNFALRDVVEQERRVSENDEALHSLRECNECHSTARLRACGHCTKHLCRECTDLHRDQNSARLGRLSRQLRAIRGRCQKCLAQRRSAFEQQQATFDIVREKVCAFTNTFLSKLTDIVRKHEQRLLDKICAYQSWFEEDLGGEIHELEANERYVDECKVRIEKIRKDTSVSVSESQFRALEKGTTIIRQKSPNEVTPEPLECRFVVPSKKQQDGVYQRVANLFDLESIACDLVIGKKQKNEALHNMSPWNVLGTGQGSAAGQLNRPLGVAVSPATRATCVADWGNHRLQRFINQDASHIPSLRKYRATDGVITYPEGVACAAETGNFVVSDSWNHRVQVVDNSGKVFTVLGERGSGAGCFNTPRGVAVDRNTGHIYVCDSGNHRVQIFGAFGEFLAKFGSKGTSNGAFHAPVGIAVAQGRVVVADCKNNRLQVFTTAGKHKRTITGDHFMTGPWGVALNQEGNKVYACCQAAVVVCQLSPTGVKLVKVIPSPVDGHRPWWIALLSESDALVTLNGVHVVHRIRVN